jgi:16S rRNA (cytidine1402-2'-O)-methyltransferase
MARRKSIGGERTSAASRLSEPPAAIACSIAAEGTQAAGASKLLTGRRSTPAGPGLYLVATPIGNAADITLRALDLLAQADVIACEDTRVTAKLLAVHGISRPLVRYDEHTARAAGAALIERVRRGERVALVSDAGTPLVSDPGERLVTECIRAGLPVVAIPGASAALTALCVSGLRAGRFLFAGFLPARSTARRRELEELAGVPATLVLLESPQRLASALADMADVLGPRDAVVARELTKLFEEVRRGSLTELAEHYRQAAVPKGEVTIVVAPPLPRPPPADAEIEALLAEALEGLSPRDAATSVAQVTGLPRRQLYARAIALKHGWEK